jgi:predicted RNA binding protein YcfA (HicA-like mRNA interferase family)
MPKLPVLKSKELISALLKDGFIKIRTKGSHIQFKKANLLVTVPFHNKDLSQETLKSILRQARMTVEDLVELL